MTPRKRAPAPSRSAARKKTTTRRGASTSVAAVEAQLSALERGDGEGELDLGRGISLHVSSLGKPYFPGITKGALMRYYTRVSPLLLPHLDNAVGIHKAVIRLNVTVKNALGLGRLQARDHLEDHVHRFSNWQGSVFLNAIL